MRQLDPDQLVAFHRFTAPRIFVAGLGVLAVSRFYGFIWHCLPEWRPLLYALWGVWFVLAGLLGVCIWQNHRMQQPWLDENNSKMVFLLLAVAIACISGVHLEARFA